ncbi:MAG: TolC family protein [Bacteroidales bacterium]|jgi:outer membrane protein|nr:TolC family protein [Bacteroidales bacterium]
MKSGILIYFAILICFATNLQAQQDSIWTLEECITHALEKNIQVRKGELSNERYQYYADQSRAQRFPSVNASLTQNYNWSKASGGSGYSGMNGSNLSINSSVTVFNGSRLTNQIKQAELDIQAGQYSLETIKESISLSIMNAYLQVLYAGEQERNTERQIESTMGQVELAAERLAIRLISQADYAQVKSQLANEKLNLANARSQLAIARVNLEQLMELPVSDDFEIAFPDPEDLVNQNRKPDVAEVYMTALGIKPQVKNAEINKEIAALDEKIARAGYYPVLSASAGAGTSYSSMMTDPYFDQINNGITPSLGLSLSIPIYQRKQVRTSVAVAQLGYQDAGLSELNTRNELRKSIEQACLDVVSAQADYEASVENYQATSESAALSDEKFRQGIINSVDYLVSKTNLILAESNLLQSKYNMIFSYKVLDFYSGIPLTL